MYCIRRLPCLAQFKSQIAHTLNVMVMLHCCRPIAMTVPDNDLIAEVLLASEGFMAAKALASKLVTLYKLAQEGLSRQQHYDWGLRALKTMLGTAGRLLRQVCVACY
jgi:hypothetical protein